MCSRRVNTLWSAPTTVSRSPSTSIVPPSTHVMRHATITDTLAAGDSVGWTTLAQRSPTSRKGLASGAIETENKGVQLSARLEMATALIRLIRRSARNASDRSDELERELALIDLNVRSTVELARLVTADIGPLAVTGVCCSPPRSWT